jgi:SAM-dependent methyltransferase
MALNDTAFRLDISRAFDAVAAEYHRTNTGNPILERMRAVVMRTLIRHVSPGARVLDLGCGPGTDHGAMLAAGYQITAIDVSGEMVRQARARAVSAGVEHRVDVRLLPIERVAELGSARFDAIVSNFGPLNCVDDLGAAAGQMRHVLKPGGLVVASVIGKVCPWEIALYVSRGDIARACLRFTRRRVAVPLKDGTVWTRYLSPGRFVRTFAGAGFRTRDLRGLGVAAPPPYLEAFAQRRPELVSRLLNLDDTIGSWPVARAMGDHFLVVMERQSLWSGR